jgi:hypothetical protein
MNSLSPLGWILILFLVFLFIGINVSLFTSQKKKDNPDSWVNRIQEAGKTLRDPFRKEDEKLNTLSEKVKELKHTQKKESDYGD